MHLVTCRYKMNAACLPVRPVSIIDIIEIIDLAQLNPDHSNKANK